MVWLTTHKTILVGVDGSNQAEAALDVAIDMARRYDVKLLIVAIYASPYMPFIPGIPAYPQVLTGFPSYSEKVPKETKEKVEALLRSYEERAKSGGVQSVEARLIPVWNTVGGGLIAEAERNDCAIIVLGSRGLTGIKRTVLGSVAEFVVKNAPCNVLIVRQ